MPRWGRSTVAKLYGGSVHYRLSEPGVDEWVKALEGVEQRALDLKPFFTRFGRYMVEGSIPRNFAAGGRPERWPPLDPDYAARKRLRWGRRPILVASGAMERGFWFDAGPRSLRIDNRVPHFRPHQYGGGNLPQRIMVLLQRQDKGWATKWMQEYIYEPLDI